MAESIFTGVRAPWQPLYETLKEQARRRFGDFEEHPTSGALTWKLGTTFAEFGAKQSGLVVNLPATRLHPEWKAIKTQQLSKNRVVHTFEVQDETTFPLLLDAIEEALALVRPARPPAGDGSTGGEYANVDEYIARYPGEVQAILRQVRATIRAAAPDATEKISWGMPTYHQGENIIHFAGFKNHLGIYPGADGMAHFAPRLGAYHTTKGAVQFPLAGAIPYDLIAEMTRYRVQEAQARG